MPQSSPLTKDAKPMEALGLITSVITEPGRVIFHFLNHAQDRLREHHIVILPESPTGMFFEVRIEACEAIVRAPRSRR